MQAISLWQPWASLLISGQKLHETRHWETRYRGPLAIHAAKRLERAVPLDLLGILEDQFGRDWRDTLPRGALLGCVFLTGIYTTEGLRSGVSRADRAAGDWSDGRFAWRCDHPRRLAQPVPITGRQGLFRVPDDLLKDAG